MDLDALRLPPAAPAAARPAAVGRRTRLGRLSTALLWGAVALAVTVVVAGALGYRTEVVLTGSMRPALKPGDMVLVGGIAAADMRVGDIVSFAAPGQHGIVITHRVRSLRPAARHRIAVVTRGDANSASEHWTIGRDGHLARVITTLPGVGAVTNWAGNALMRLLVFGALGLLALVAGLRWVWGRP